MTECIYISPWTCIDDHVKKPALCNVRYAIRQSMTYMAYSLPRCCVASNRLFQLKMPSKLIRILRITFCYNQLCGRCLVHMTPVVKVVIHCVFALL